LDRMALAGIILAVLAAAFFVLVIVRTPFPTFTPPGQSERYVDITSDVGSEDNQFMWVNLSTSLAGQAFIIFAAAAGCLAMLRLNEKGSE
jgi:hypothetical protein